MKYLISLSVTTMIAAFDQATKIFVHTHFNLHESFPVIRGFFSFTYIQNAGGAFGMFNNASSLVRIILFIILPILAFMLILKILHRMESRYWPGTLALSFILGGALGNMIDRFRLGYVIDFLDFHLPNGWAFPTFNIADSCVVIGVFLVALLAYIHPKKLPL